MKIAISQLQIHLSPTKWDSGWPPDRTPETSISIFFAGRWTQRDWKWKSPLVGLSSGTAAACSCKPFKACALNWRLTCHSASAMHTHRSPGHGKVTDESNSDSLKGSAQKSHPAACTTPLGLLEVTE